MPDCLPLLKEAAAKVNEALALVQREESHQALVEINLAINCVILGESQSELPLAAPQDP